MRGSEIRKRFLDYFAKNGHQIVKSSGLIPQNDPTLLFTNAGMNQFKNIFLGLEKTEHKRACSSQKCVRAGGKHNDLENVGNTARHHTFFEMLGNFSFGDYFKKDAIQFGWDFLTKEMQLPKEKLWVTVYKDDDEASRLWQEIAGVSPDRIVRLGEKDNFWSMGDEGPCGPCSEIIIDQGEGIGCGASACKVGCDCDRYLELWNLVFMQYNRTKDGQMLPLPNPSIDTGMGLERISAVKQGVRSNFETDLLFPYIEEVSKLAKTPYGKDVRKDVHMRVIADHIRAVTFLISDGVFPSNEGRGYVLRRILRRGIRHAKMLGFSKPVLNTLSAKVLEVMGDAYPELKENHELVKKVILNEEERFFETLDGGLRILSEEVEKLKAKRSAVLSGEVAFKLYDTYGFPLDLTQDILKEESMTVDLQGFESHMEVQREQARKSWKGEGEAVDALYKKIAQELKVEFVGYEILRAQAMVKKIIKNGKEVVELGTGEAGEFIFDKTPFYGESGGQAGDTGEITGKQFTILVSDTKKIEDLIIHRGIVDKGSVRTGDEATMSVLTETRGNTASHHTATHLLQAALQRTLGSHVKQAGSLVDPERLRFDFTHFAPLSEDETKKIESMINQWIRENRKVSFHTLAHDEAVKRGAMAIFGEKYGDVVRMVEVDGVSKELCGGTHQTMTGNIGFFKILSEESVASGIRRIEACAGGSAVKWVQDFSDKNSRLAALLKTSPKELESRIERVLKQEKELERELESVRARLSSYLAKESMDKREIKPGVFAIAAKMPAETVDQLRTILDGIKEKEKNAVIFLAAEVQGKAAVLLHVPDDITNAYDAGKLLQEIMKDVNGRGGGKKNMAQGGCPDPKSIETAIKKFYSLASK